MNQLSTLLLALSPLLASASPTASPTQEQEVPPTESEEISPEQQEVAEEASAAEVTEIVSKDAALKERLSALLRAVDTFDGIRPIVKAGVVRLRGIADSRAQAEAAVALTEKLDGVLFVMDEMDVDKSVKKRLSNGLDDLERQGREAVAYLPLLALAGIVVALAYFLARLLRDAKRGYGWLTKKVLLQNLVRQTIFALVLLGGLIVALNLLDAGAVIGTVLGAAGVLGLALGFAFRDIVENYLSGILLALRQPFNAQDYVDIDGKAGTVIRMTPSETVLMTADGNHLRMPNSSIFKGNILNYSRNPLRRFIIGLGVGVDEDLVQAQNLGLTVLNEMNGVLDDPGPSSRITELGDSDVRLEFYGWVNQAEASFVKVSSEAVRLVKTRMDDAGVEMPVPGYHVNLTSAAGLEETNEPQIRKPKADSGPSPQEIDIAPEDDVQRQVEQEIAASAEDNLLDD